jgi:putative transposase
MPRGLIRYQRAGDFHFVTFSSYHRLPYLGTPTARSLFERSLETMRARYEFFIAGYVIMPEHVHLLVSEPRRVLLAKALQALKLSVAVQSRQRPFWLHRYYDFNVCTEAKYTEKLRYMHRNPVARGLVSQPNQWAWSSFRHYATGEVGTIEIESHWTARRRGGLPTSLQYSTDTPQTHISESRCGAPASEGSR